MNGDREWTRRGVVAVCVPVAVMLGLGLWGLDRDGIWRDEGVTFQVARRSVPEIWLGLGARPLASVALPLMAVPPGLLIAVSQMRPMYDDRYVVYALAGAPLLAAAGADRVAGLRPSLSPLIPLALALAFLHHLPLHRQDRSPTRRPDNLAATSAFAARHLRPGDPVLYLPSIGRAYPEGFRRAWDIALGQPGPGSGTLYGREVGAAELRRRLDSVDRVWVVAEPYALDSPWYPRNPTERLKVDVVGEEFRRLPSQQPEGPLRLYVRRAAAPVPPPASTTPPAPRRPEPG